MSVSTGGATLTNVGQWSTSSGFRIAASNTHSNRFMKSYYGQYIFTGGTTTFDVSTITLGSDTGLGTAGVIEIILCGVTPPTGSTFSNRGVRRYVIAFHFITGGLSTSTLESQHFDESGSIDMPIASLIDFGTATLKVRLSYPTTDTHEIRLATHITWLSGGQSGPGQGPSIT